MGYRRSSVVRIVRLVVDETHFGILRQGVETWNQWRTDNPEVKPDLSRSDLSWSDLSWANLSGAHLTYANLGEAILGGADLSGARLFKAWLFKANLRGANLVAAHLVAAHLGGADLGGADLSGANLHRAGLQSADLSGANLGEAILGGADLSGANLSGANLRGADLAMARLVGTAVERADLSGALVYGVSVWDLEGTPAEQNDLVITRRREPAVTVDDLKVAQFIHLLLSNPNIRDVIDTVGEKCVLILGRFGERKPVLDKLRVRLRELGFAPMVFDFEKPVSKDFTETVRTLAGMSAFIVADITAPKSVPQEAQATIPDYMVPFVPIIEDGEEPWSMFEDLWRKYDNWVFEPLVYGSIDELIPRLETAVVRPALEKREDLLVRRAKKMGRRSLDAFPLDT